jgi:hypothetical protein
MGNSGGVFPTLFYGAKLNANVALCFSGPSSLDIGLAAGKPVFLTLKTLHEKGQVPWPNLRELVASSPMQVRYFYGSESARDVAQAENLAGLPRVSLECLEGVKTHGVLDKLAARGLLEEIFKSACRPSISERIVAMARKMAGQMPGHRDDLNR